MAVNSNHVRFPVIGKAALGVRQLGEGNWVVAVVEVQDCLEYELDWVDGVWSDWQHGDQLVVLVGGGCI